MNLTYNIYLSLLLLSTMQFAFSDTPEWEDNPGGYEFTSYLIGAIVLNNSNEQLGDDGDMFATFDSYGYIRGVGVQLTPPFGPYQGTPVWEMTMRSNSIGDTLSFRYYDASENQIFEISEIYEFSINEQIGDIINPSIFHFEPELYAPPEEFNFNQSTLQAFYFFQSVAIDSIIIESDDWVGAFNGDKCVGSIQWDLNACNGICGVPVMGDDGSVYTDGYMLTNQNPIFKIYDTSENTMYDAYPSINHGFTNNGMFMIESLQNGNPTIDYCIPLLEGANLISFYALPDDPSLSNVLSPIVGDVTGAIGEGVSALYNSTLGGWIGSLTELDCQSGYWIITTNNLELCVENGMSCSNEYHLYEGANLISFPFPNCATIGDALPDDMENYIKGIISEGVAATNLVEFGWVGSLTQLCGTKGYWFISDIELDFSFEIEPR